MKRGVKHKSPSLGSIRIISGQWRGRKLPVLDAQGLRPTTDRTKETLFNWLIGEINQVTCLDMFAGSGGLGFEALSRGATSVTFMEQQVGTAQQLINNCQLLGVSSSQAAVIKGDAIKGCQSLNKPFDLIFIDPPFHNGLVDMSIEALVFNQLIQSGTLIYIEHEKGITLQSLPKTWQCVKEKHTSQVSYALYRVTG